MRNKAFIIILMILFNLYCSDSNNSSKNDPAKPVKSVFMYEFPENIENEFLTLVKLEINRVYLSISDAFLYSSDNKKEEFFNVAKKHRVSIHAMTLENTKYLFPEHFDEALETVESLTSLIINNKTFYFEGINIDVEPHALFKGESPFTDEELVHNSDLMKKYLNLLEQINALLLLHPHIDFSADIAWWYNEIALEGIITEGSIENLANYTDHLIPMVYDGIGGDSQDVINRISDEMLVSPMVIGLGVHEFSSIGDLEKTIKELNDHFKNSPNYRGVVIYNYFKYKQL